MSPRESKAPSRIAGGGVAHQPDHAAVDRQEDLVAEVQLVGLVVDAGQVAQAAVLGRGQPELDAVLAVVLLGIQQEHVARR